MRTNESLKIPLKSWVNSFSVIFCKLSMCYVEVNLLKTWTAQELYGCPNYICFTIFHLTHTHFFPTLNISEIELLMLSCNVIGHAAVLMLLPSWHCLSKHGFGHHCSYCLHFHWIRHIIDITCFGFLLYLKIFKKITLWFGTETKSLCKNARKEVEQQVVNLILAKQIFIIGKIILI